MSQLDTASLISLIKSKFILSNLITGNIDNDYEELNGSALEVLGQVKAQIIRRSSSTGEVILRVVPDYTMKCDVLLGKDTIRLLWHCTILHYGS